VREYEFHPLANVFPLMEGDEFEALVDDIKKNGQRELIVVFEDKILDGRNRYRACLAADVEPTFAPYLGDDALAFVVSANLRRRHLNESQRSIVAGRLAKLKDGQRQVGQLAEVPTQGEAATMLNVGERSVRRAREVLDHGAPELAQAVERGEVSVSAAAQVSSLPEDEQREVVAGGDEVAAKKAKELRKKRQAASRKGAEIKRRKEEERQRKQEAAARERQREREAIEVKKRGLASKLIGLDRDLARALYEAVEVGWTSLYQFCDALGEGLGLKKPDDEPEANDDEPEADGNGAATASYETGSQTWDEVA